MNGLILFLFAFAFHSMILWALFYLIFAKGQKWLMLPGFLVDVVYNLVWGSILFIEPPKQFTLTQRIKRHTDKATWRGKIARLICAKLNKYDPGHC